MELQGAHVLVTGASKGIGAAIAREVAGRGADVSVVARSGDLLEPLAEELDGRWLAVDLTDDTHLAGLVERVEEQAGRPVDVLVNNAGVEVASLLERMDEDEIARVIALDLIAPLRLTRQVLPGMIERDRGHIVQISSAAGVLPTAGMAVYNGAKGGLTHASRALRQELKGTDVGHTVATLGPIDTDMWDRVNEDPSVARVVGRFRRLQQLPTVRTEVVATDVADAIERGDRHVRHPKRSLPLYTLAEAPTRIVEAVLVGMKPRKATSAPTGTRPPRR